MKTIEEFIKEIECSEALQNELKEIKDRESALNDAGIYLPEEE